MPRPMTMTEKILATHAGNGRNESDPAKTSGSTSMSS